MAHEMLKAGLGLAALFGGLGVASLAGDVIGTEATHFAMTHRLLSMGDVLSGPVVFNSPEGEGGLWGSAISMSVFMGGVSLIYGRRASKTGN